MKKLKTFVITCAFTLCALGASALGLGVYRGQQTKIVPVCAAQSAYAMDMYDMLTPKIIKLYEDEISHKPVVSNMSQKQLARLADRFGISVQKTKTILVLQDLIAQTGDSVNISELASMSNSEIIKCGKKYMDKYGERFTDEQKEELKQKLKEAMK